MGIVVFGSINMDLVARVARLPTAGETLLARSFQTIPGGKGANQAVAAARLGIPPKMLGRVGADSFGQPLLQSLQAAGVDTRWVTADPESSSGTALIAVADSGENQIIVVPGANGQVGETELTQLTQQLQPGDLLLLQFEIPLPVVERAVAIAHQMGATVIVDPAPAHSGLPDPLYTQIDILTPNETEAEQFVGFSIDDRTAEKALQVLIRRGVGTVILKRGRHGVTVGTADVTFSVPAFPVTAVDTVAAGDAFNGGLAVAVVEGKPLTAAVTWASAVAALSVTKPGAQSSLPDRAAVEAFLAAQSRPAEVG
ncbi:MAG: ribokinase [Cyanobacteria bacterium P01_D01_bin.14]